MGAWGEESCSNDSVLDILDEYFITEEHYTQNDADNCMNDVISSFLSRKPSSLRYDSTCFQDLVGCAVWILRDEKIISHNHLVIARAAAQWMRDSEEYLEEWNNPKLRKAHLEKEIAEFEYAMKNGGKLDKKVEIPTLMDKAVSWLEEQENHDG